MKEGLFHLTLGMLLIVDIQGIQAAVNMVETIRDEASQIIHGRNTCLEIRNLNNFGHRFVYAEVHPKEPHLFSDFVEFIKAKFTAIGDKVKCTNSFEFIPHVTLAKVSRPISKMRRSQYISQAYYVDHQTKYFGAQNLDNLNLCIIESSTRYDGFYTTLTDVRISMNDG